jgi:hypothetical protein
MSTLRRSSGRVFLTWANRRRKEAGRSVPAKGVYRVVNGPSPGLPGARSRKVNPRPPRVGYRGMDSRFGSNLRRGRFRLGSSPHPWSGITHRVPCVRRESIPDDHLTTPQRVPDSSAESAPSHRGTQLRGCGESSGRGSQGKQQASEGVRSHVRVPYIGKSQYCYSNSLAMVLAAHPLKDWEVPTPGRIECLTTMPFGVLWVRRSSRALFFFSPPNTNPDDGIDQALRALGWECDTFVGTSKTPASAALKRLVQALADGPALVGPLDLGGFLHNPSARELTGGDHFVAAYAAERNGIAFHDPYLYPHAWLPNGAFLRAWKPGGRDYRQGPFTFRHNFRPRKPASPSQAIQRTVPKLLPALTANPGGPSVFGSLAALDHLGEQVRKGLPASLRGFLVYFSISLGARRRCDAAEFAAEAGFPNLSSIFDQQARLLGRAQLSSALRQDRELAKQFDEFRELEARAIDSLA